MRLDALEAAIAEDKKRGIRPLCLVGIFGTTNTGAVDSIRALRPIAGSGGMWLHADAAYGGGMLPHTWPMRNQGLNWPTRSRLIHTSGSTPLDAGAILVMITAD